MYTWTSLFRENRSHIECRELWLDVPVTWRINIIMIISLILKSYLKVLQCLRLLQNILVMLFWPNLEVIELSMKIIPSWPRWLLRNRWPQQCITLCPVVLPTKFSNLITFLSKVTLRWHRMTDASTLTQQCITLWHVVLLTRCGSRRVLLSKLTPGWPEMTLQYLKHKQSFTLWSRVCMTKFGSKSFLCKLTSRWPLTYVIISKGWPKPLFTFHLLSYQASARYVATLRNA